MCMTTCLFSVCCLIRNVHHKGMGELQWTWQRVWTDCPTISLNVILFHISTATTQQHQLVLMERHCSIPMRQAGCTDLAPAVGCHRIAAADLVVPSSDVDFACGCYHAESPAWCCCEWCPAGPHFSHCINMIELTIVITHHVDTSTQDCYFRVNECLLLWMAMMPAASIHSEVIHACWPASWHMTTNEKDHSIHAHRHMITSMSQQVVQLPPFPGGRCVHNTYTAVPSSCQNKACPLNLTYTVLIRECIIWDECELLVRVPSVNSFFDLKLENEKTDLEFVFPFSDFEIKNEKRIWKLLSVF